MTEINNINHLHTELNNTKIAYQEAVENNLLKTGYMGRIAHEIRSPLSSLMGLHQLIINDLCESQEEEREFIREAYQYAKKLMAIIDQFIEVSKLEIGRINPDIEKVNLAELFADIKPIITLEAKNKNLKFDCENIAENSQDFVIKTDRVRLTNILIFLLEVAIDYSEAGEIFLTVNKQDKGIKINIDFPSKASVISENIDFLKTPIEELKQLNKLPQLSNGMKLMVTDTILKILGGYLSFNQTEAKETIQWQLFLPTEIV